MDCGLWWSVPNINNNFINVIRERQTRPESSHSDWVLNCTAILILETTLSSQFGHFPSRWPPSLAGVHSQLPDGWVSGLKSRWDQDSQEMPNANCNHFRSALSTAYLCNANIFVGQSQAITKTQPWPRIKVGKSCGQSEEHVEKSKSTAYGQTQLALITMENSRSGTASHGYGLRTLGF